MGVPTTRRKTSRPRALDNVMQETGEVEEAGSGVDNCVPDETLYKKNHPRSVASLPYARPQPRDFAVHKRH